MVSRDQFNIPILKLKIENFNLRMSIHITNLKLYNYFYFVYTDFFSIYYFILIVLKK